MGTTWICAHGTPLGQYCARCASGQNLTMVRRAVASLIAAIEAGGWWR